MIFYGRCFFQVMVWLLLLMYLGNTQECNLSGFRLSCKKNKVTMLEFPHHIRLSVANIDYTTHGLLTFDHDNCLPRLFLKLHNSSMHPFQFDSDEESVAFFDCSSLGSPQLKSINSGDQSLGINSYRSRSNSCPIIAASRYDSVVNSGVVLCTRMLELVSSVPASDLRSNNLKLRWSQQNCDADDFHCKNKPIKISVILSATGPIVLILLLIAFFQIYRYFKMKGDDQARVRTFLKDYRALQPTRFSYSDLKRITNNFKEKLGEGAHGAVFKGKLSNEIVVAVKLLNNNPAGDGEEFINEVGIMGKIHHIDIVRLLGFCADGIHRALVYDFFPNGSLQNFISPPDNIDRFLGWEKLEKIAIGIAKGIEYLHQGCDRRILHFDINPHNVLLDHNFTPKISDFGLAKLCSKSQSIISMTAAKGTLGYIAPEVFFRNFENVSYKADIYSYGMLIIEMIAGRKNINISENSFQVLYPEWIHNLVEREDTCNYNIEDEVGIKIAKKLAIVGLWCIQWYPMNRPSMKTVLQMLEGEVDKLKVPPTPLDPITSAGASTSTSATAAIPIKRQHLELEVIHELE